MSEARRVYSYVVYYSVLSAAILLCLAGIAKLPFGFSKVLYGVPSILIGAADLGIGLLILFKAGRSASREPQGATRGPIILAISLFVLYAFVNALQVLQGKSSCDCFGSISITPIWMLVADLYFALMLSFFLWQKETQIVGDRSWIIAALGIASLFHTISVGQETPSETAIKLSPQNVKVSVNHTIGHYEEFQIRVENSSAEEFRLIGWNSDCHCLSTEDQFPIEVPGHGFAYLTMIYDRELVVINEDQIPEVREEIGSAEAMLDVGGDTHFWLIGQNAKNVGEVSVTYSISPEFVRLIFPEESERKLE